MEHFEIRNPSLIMIRRGLGFFIIITSLLSMFLYIRSFKIAYFFAFFSFLILGIYQITNGLGFERSWFRTGSDFITIKWSNMINPVQIHNSRIAGIRLSKSEILIYRKAGNPIILKLSWLETNQKNEVCKFLIEYCKKRNMNVVMQER